MKEFQVGASVSHFLHSFAKNCQETIKAYMKKLALFLLSLSLAPSALAQLSCKDFFEAPKKFVSQNIEISESSRGDRFASGVVLNYGYYTVSPQGAHRYLLHSYISMNYSITGNTLSVLNISGRLIKPHKFVGYFRPMVEALVAENPGIFNVVVKIQGPEAQRFFLQKQEGLSDAEALALSPTYGQLAAAGFAQVKNVEVMSFRVREKDGEGKSLPLPELNNFIQLTLSR